MTRSQQISLQFGPSRGAQFPGAYADPSVLIDRVRRSWRDGHSLRQLADDNRARAIELREAPQSDLPRERFSRDVHMSTHPTVQRIELLRSALRKTRPGEELAQRTHHRLLYGQHLIRS